MRPFLGKFAEASASIRSVTPTASSRVGFFLNERYCDSVTLKRTQMGSSGTMVVSGCCALAVTNPPTGNQRVADQAADRARMVAYSRFKVAVRNAARLASTFPCVDEICVCVESRV
jgi:hypothetical protein